MIEEKEIEKLLHKNKNIPYPPIPKLYPNKRYANMLYDDFAGELGELSAITQYVYEHIELKEKTILSKTLLEIAIQEMRHLDIVGEVIKMLGEKPIYVNSNQDLWNAKNVKYCTGDIAKTMEYNIYSEEMAIVGYQKAIRYTQSGALRKVFERIILDERVHKEVFQQLKCFS